MWACSARRRRTARGRASVGGAVRTGTSPPEASPSRFRTPSTTSAWSTAPAAATTTLAGRYQRWWKATTSSRPMAPIESRVPSTSRPSGWSGNRASASRVSTRSSGVSSSMASSSRITARSASTSSARRAGLQTTSDSTSSPRSSSAAGSRAWKAVCSAAV